METASVQVAGSVTGQINHGLLVYIGIEKMDQVAYLLFGVISDQVVMQSMVNIFLKIMASIF